MNLKFLLSFLFGSIAVVVIIKLTPDYQTLVTFYGKNIRGELFSGFLTLGGFLLSLKTFIIVKMKENVYDSESYQQSFSNKKKINPKLSLYAPLQRLSHLLFWAILVSLFASISQFSFGLINHWGAVIFCIFLAVFAISLLIFSLIEIKNNLDAWFKLIE
jgi:hypothetical protein